MRTLAAAFAFVYGSALALVALQALFLGGPDNSSVAGGIGIAITVVAAFVYPVGMDPAWWLGLALLSFALRRGGHLPRPTAV